MASIEEGLQDVRIHQGEIAEFTCKFSKGDVLQIDVDWMVGNVKYDDCARGTAEEDLGSDGNGCYTTDTQSVLLLKNNSIAGMYLVQCTLKQSVPNDCRNHSSIPDDFKSIKRSASLLIGNSTPCRSNSYMHFSR